MVGRRARRRFTLIERSRLVINSNQKRRRGGAAGSGLDRLLDEYTSNDILRHVSVGVRFSAPLSSIETDIMTATSESASASGVPRLKMMYRVE